MGAFLLVYLIGTWPTIIRVFKEQEMDEVLSRFFVVKAVPFFGRRATDKKKSGNVARLLFVHMAWPPQLELHHGGGHPQDGL